MAKKERDIVKLLYEENKEYECLKTWFYQKIRKNRCKAFCSLTAQKEFNIPITTIASSIIGYIEDLELQIQNAPCQIQ